jgi:hypothetical protein
MLERLVNACRQQVIGHGKDFQPFFKSNGKPFTYCKQGGNKFEFKNIIW